MSTLSLVSSEMLTDLIYVPGFMFQVKCQQILYVCLDSCLKSNVNSSYMSTLIHVFKKFKLILEVSLHSCVKSNVKPSYICLDSSVKSDVN